MLFRSPWRPAQRLGMHWPRVRRAPGVTPPRLRCPRRLLPDDDDDNCELIRAIAQTVSKTFWVPLREPCPRDRYTIWEIAVSEELRRGGLRKPPRLK